MQVKGRIKEILPTREGDTANGHWSQQTFAIEVKNEYNGNVFLKDLAFDVWNNKVQIPQRGTVVTVSFDAESRKGKTGGYFTSLKAFKIETELPQPSQQQPVQQQPTQSGSSSDDLPF